MITRRDFRWTTLNVDCLVAVYRRLDIVTDVDKTKFITHPSGRNASPSIHQDATNRTPAGSSNGWCTGGTSIETVPSLGTKPEGKKLSICQSSKRWVMVTNHPTIPAVTMLWDDEDLVSRWIMRCVQDYWKCFSGDIAPLPHAHNSWYWYVDCMPGSCLPMLVAGNKRWSFVLDLILTQSHTIGSIHVDEIHPRCELFFQWKEVLNSVRVLSITQHFPRLHVGKNSENSEKKWIEKALN